jgi:hypothetical protein
MFQHRSGLEFARIYFTQPIVYAAAIHTEKNHSSTPETENEEGAQGANLNQSSSHQSFCQLEYAT